MKKYTLIEDDVIQIQGITLKRIKALRDINFVKTNKNESFCFEVGAGDLGGYIESEENLSQEGDAWIGEGAAAFGDARVKDSALVMGTVELEGEVSGNAFFRADNKKTESSNISSVDRDVKICDNAFIHVGEIEATGKTYLFGNAYLTGAIYIEGSYEQSIPPVRVEGDVSIIANEKTASFSACLIMEGAHLLGDVTLFNPIILSGTYLNGSDEALELEYAHLCEVAKILKSTDHKSFAEYPFHYFGGSDLFITSDRFSLYSTREGSGGVYIAFGNSEYITKEPVNTFIDELRLPEHQNTAETILYYEQRRDEFLQQLRQS